QVISRSTNEDGSSLIVTGTIGPIDTEALRNKLYTAYLSVERPQALAAPRDVTGLIWDPDIEQQVSAEEQAAADRFGVMPEMRPFPIPNEGFTMQVRHV